MPSDRAEDAPIAFPFALKIGNRFSAREDTPLVAQLLRISPEQAFPRYPGACRSPLAVKPLLSLLAFLLFASGVYLIQGNEPQLGPDHVVYLSLANNIIEKQPQGDYFREWSSVRSLGVLLASCFKYTHSHIASLKAILFINTLLFFGAYQLFASTYITSFRYLLLFTLISGMAVSFGVTSWGLSDYTALLPRTLGAPWIILCFWLFFRYPNDVRRYFAFPLLVLVSILHLSAFHALGVLVALEFFEWVVLLHFRLSKRTIYFPISLVVSFLLLLALESSGKSMDATGFVRWILKPDTSHDGSAPDSGGAKGKSKLMSLVSPDGHAEARFTADSASSAVPPPPDAPVIRVAAPPPYTPAVAWRFELGARAWRNMPIPFVNLANILSSYLLIAIMALLGFAEAWRRGLTEWDKRMSLFVIAILVASFGLQTSLWLLRQFAPIYPINFEEIRSLSFLMIPSLYFIYTLFLYGAPKLKLKPSPAFRAGVCSLTLLLPLSMKSLTPGIREKIFGTLCWTGVVDMKNDGAVQNARLALGLARGPRYYYDTRNIARWINVNLPRTAVILTDRDDLLDEKFFVIGTRQQAALANPDQNPKWVQDFALRTARALAHRSSSEMIETAKDVGAAYAIVPWTDPGSLYSDGTFSLLKVP